jgi:hypothetical protein
MNLRQLESSDPLQAIVIAAEFRLKAGESAEAGTPPALGQIAAAVAELYRPLARRILVELGSARRLPV